MQGCREEGFVRYDALEVDFNIFTQGTASTRKQDLLSNYRL
jgi:hypothetical protein